MSVIKLVALDLDGTLLTSRKTISRRTHTALRKTIDGGVQVVLATARPPRS
ncbi:MAG: HAD hydrolase family protein, partial [Phycisphaerae bacterium]